VCPENSVGYDPGGSDVPFCAKLCNSDNDCRQNEGYQCRNTPGGTVKACSQ
jgi:hypothetical protein